ncbi:hypothetical protein AB205_0191590, partial [Aquarana catesbeiana]
MRHVTLTQPISDRGKEPINLDVYHVTSCVQSQPVTECKQATVTSCYWVLLLTHQLCLVTTHSTHQYTLIALSNKEDLSPAHLSTRAPVTTPQSTRIPVTSPSEYPSTCLQTRVPEYLSSDHQSTRAPVTSPEYLSADHQSTRVPVSRPEYPSTYLQTIRVPEHLSPAQSTCLQTIRVPEYLSPDQSTR